MVEMPWNRVLLQHKIDIAVCVEEDKWAVTQIFQKLKSIPT